MSITVVYRDGKFEPLEPVSMPEESVLEVFLVPVARKDVTHAPKLTPFEALGTKDFGMPSDDFKDIPPEFEEYIE